MTNEEEKLRKRHLKTLQRRMNYLSSKIGKEEESKRTSFDLAERSALRWAIQQLTPNGLMPEEPTS